MGDIYVCKRCDKSVYLCTCDVAVPADKPTPPDKPDAPREWWIRPNTNDIYAYKPRPEHAVTEYTSFYHVIEHSAYAKLLEENKRLSAQLKVMDKIQQDFAMVNDKLASQYPRELIEMKALLKEVYKDLYNAEQYVKDLLIVVAKIVDWADDGAAQMKELGAIVEEVRAIYAVHKKGVE